MVIDEWRQPLYLGIVSEASVLTVDLSDVPHFSRRDARLDDVSFPRP